MTFAEVQTIAVAIDLALIPPGYRKNQESEQNTPVLEYFVCALTSDTGLQS